MPLPGGLCPVDYRSRAAWGADESFRHGDPPQYFPAQTITVHHSVTPNNPPDPVAVVKAIYNTDTHADGYDDLGYQLLIDHNGVVYEGRWTGTDPWPVFSPDSSALPRVVTGAHVGGYNSGNIGVCLIGDFHNFPGVVPTEAARQALVTVLAWLCGICGIDPLATVPYVNPVDPTHVWSVKGVCGHQDWNNAPGVANNTACPGQNFVPFLSQVRTAVAAAVAELPLPRRRPAPTSTPGLPGDSGRPAPTAPVTPDGGDRPPATDGPPPMP